MKVISTQLPLPGKHPATLWGIIPYSLFPLFDDVFKIFESPPGARCYSGCRFRGAEDKWFLYLRISQAKFPDHQYLFLLLTFRPQEAMCSSQSSLISSIPFSCGPARHQRHSSLVWHGLNLPLLDVVTDRNVGGFSTVSQYKILW